MLKYKDFELIQPSEEYEKQILNLIEEKGGSVFHEVGLNKIVEQIFKTKLFYLVDNPSSMTSLSPVHITKNRFGLNKYHFKPLYDIPYAGFVGENVNDNSNFSIGFFESMDFVGFPYKEKGNSSDEYVGETSMVKLSLEEDEIFMNIINSKRRNMIRKAMKEGITIKAFTEDEGLKEFWSILKPLHDKLGYDHLNYDYYESILKHYGKKKQAFILIAYKESIPISGVFIIGNKNYMHYYKGASVYNIKNEGQGELLQWEAIKLSKSLGVQYYDLCNLSKEELPAIYKFKTGISDTIYEYPQFQKSSLGYKIINKLSHAKITK